MARNKGGGILVYRLGKVGIFRKKIWMFVGQEFQFL
jgi:hypothetical protein